MDDTNERELIARAQQGERTAIGALYDRHFQAVYNYIYFRVSDQHTAEDLSAEVFMRMLHKLPGYVDRGRPLLAWLYAIARNLVIDHHRSGEQRQEQELQEDLHISPIPGPSWQFQQAQESDCFKQALARLPDSQSRLLVYRFVDGFSTEKILSLVNKSDRAVRSLQHRALRSMEKALVEEGCL